MRHLAYPNFVMQSSNVTVSDCNTTTPTLSDTDGSVISMDLDTPNNVAPHSTLIPRQLSSHTRRLTQPKLPFKPVPRDQWLAQETRRYHEQQAQRKEEEDRFQLTAARLKTEHRKYERLRKRAQRDRQKKARIALGLPHRAKQKVSPAQVSFSIVS